MLNGNLVFDAVAHSFNLTEENFAYPRHAQAVTEMIYGVVSQAPKGYRLAPEAVYRDWHAEDTAAMLFGESATDVAVFHPTPIFAYKDGLSGVDKAHEAITKYPKRFVGAYAAVDPLLDDPIAELDRQVELLRPIGLKLYPTSWAGDTFGSWRMDDPEIAFPLFERAAEHGIRTIAVHKAIPLGPSPTGPSFHPGDVEIAAERYPDLNFEIVHGGAAFCEETAWLLGRYPNIYVNMESLNIILVNQQRTFAKIVLGLMHVGGEPVLDRLFWGTGTMQYHPRPCLELFADFEFPEDLRRDYGLFGELPQLTEEHRAKMLGLNFAELHGFDVDELRKGFEGDEFDRDPSQPEPAPYSTTSVADKVVEGGKSHLPVAPLPAG